MQSFFNLSTLSLLILSSTIVIYGILARQNKLPYGTGAITVARNSKNELYVHLELA
jgi:hypothetical protein